MIDLKATPYNLSDDDINWVEKTIAHMSDEEKVGQLFFQLTASQEEDYLRELMKKYHLGGCRYNGMVGEKVLAQNRILQKYAKIPVFIACNPEKGGDGVCSDGTTVGSGIKVAATDKLEYAEAMGRVSGVQMAGAGCNMAFAPVVDIVYNHECEEVLSRSFGNKHERVALMGKAYINGLHQTEGVASVAKHFPGNGQDYRDAHVSNNVNNFDFEEWMATYGHVYKTLIDGGLDAIMGGHILMPALMNDVKPGIRPKEILPATLCYEIMTTLLRDELGFNGMVVTDASHMVGMTNRMKRCDMLPLAINAGCDMFLFFNDPDEDYNTMLNAYKSGIISEARMTEALMRILGLKAKMGLNKKSKEELCPSEETLESALKNTEFKAFAPAISRDAITLVKNLDKNVLPISPKKTKRILIVPIKGSDNPMMTLMAMATGKMQQKTPAKKLKERLEAKGFEVFIYESPLDKIKDMIAKGERPSLNIYFAGKHAISDFVSQQDLVISLFDVINGHPSFGLSKGGGEIPWYVHEIPVIGISVNKPTILADCPMLRTYINAYDSADYTMDALVDALLTGDFRGNDPIDSFCGMWDTKI